MYTNKMKTTHVKPLEDAMRYHICSQGSGGVVLQQTEVPACAYMYCVVDVNVQRKYVKKYTKNAGSADISFAV